MIRARCDLEIHGYIKIHWSISLVPIYNIISASVKEEGHVKGYFHGVFWPFFIFLTKKYFLAEHLFLASITL